MNEVVDPGGFNYISIEWRNAALGCPEVAADFLCRMSYDFGGYLAPDKRRRRLIRATRKAWCWVLIATGRRKSAKPALPFHRIRAVPMCTKKTKMLDQKHRNKCLGMHT